MGRGGVPSVSVTEISADGSTQNIAYHPIAGSQNYITTKFVITGSGLTTKNITLDLASISFLDPDYRYTTVTVTDSHLSNCTLTLSTDSKSLSATCSLMPVEKEFSIVVIAKDNTTGKTIFTSDKPIDYSLDTSHVVPSDTAQCGFPIPNQIDKNNSTARTPMSAAFECSLLRGNTAYGGNIKNNPGGRQSKWQLLGTTVQGKIWMAPISAISSTRKIWFTYSYPGQTWCDVNDNSNRIVYIYDNNQNKLTQTVTSKSISECKTSNTKSKCTATINDQWRLPTFPRHRRNFRRL